MTKIWAHRGASGYAPENTLEAFALAVEQEADGVELDIQLTKDQRLVVIHDETLDRVSERHGYVKDFEWKELCKIPVNRTIPEYKEVFIPTLEDVYQLLKSSGLTVNVELKTGVIWYPQIEEKVLALTKEMGMLEQVIFSSFNHISIKKIKEIEPKAKTGILYSDVLYQAAEYSRKVEADALHPVFYHRYIETVWKEYQKAQIPLHIWTVNTEKEMNDLIGEGVEAIITNYPDKARMVRKKVQENR